MNRLLVLLVVGLTPGLLGAHTPNINRLRSRGGMCPLTTVEPALTCSVQSSLLTGLTPREHGAVANGWYQRDVSEIWMWKQSNRLIAGEKLWEAAKRRDPEFSCAQLCWWYNMYSSVDISVTPRPIYLADGRKLPDHHTHPPELRAELSDSLGVFPLFRFWGPMADIVSSEWIAAAAELVIAERKPTLTLCYLPHLDYNLQRLGPDLAEPRLQQDLREIDALCGRLIESADRQGCETVIVSEYGISAVTEAIPINRILRRAGLLRVREELGRELLDPGASPAFALADHQVAHVYVREPAQVPAIRQLLARVEGIERILDAEGKRAAGLDHPRSGELVLFSRADRWFSYPYWLDDGRAPDFARCVDIHRKPGYDPMELFLDPGRRFPKLHVAKRLAQKKLGFRSLMDVIPIAPTSLVKGSHGRITDAPEDGPLVITGRAEALQGETLHATEFKDFVLTHIFDS